MAGPELPLSPGEIRVLRSAGRDPNHGLGTFQFADPTFYLLCGGGIRDRSGLLWPSADQLFPQARADFDSHPQAILWATPGLKWRPKLAA